APVRWLELRPPAGRPAYLPGPVTASENGFARPDARGLVPDHQWRCHLRWAEYGPLRDSAGPFWGGAAVVRGYRRQAVRRGPGIEPDQAGCGRQRRRMAPGRPGLEPNEHHPHPPVPGWPGRRVRLEPWFPRPVLRPDRDGLCRFFCSLHSRRLVWLRRT